MRSSGSRDREFPGRECYSELKETPKLTTLISQKDKLESPPGPYGSAGKSEETLNIRYGLVGVVAISGLANAGP